VATLNIERGAKSGPSSRAASSNDRPAEIGWSSRSAFIFASIGFAVGLGNIWRFPYMVGENGGSAFVLVYLLCVFVIGMPILVAELMIGRIGRGSCSVAVLHTATQENRSPRWRGVGYVNMLTAFLVTLIYSGIVGWVLYYLYKAVSAGFGSFDASTSAAAYSAMLQDNVVMIFWCWTGLAITAGIAFLGLKAGVERAVSVMIPVLIAVLLLLAGYGALSEGFAPAVNYLFDADFSKINGSVFLVAIGQAFFSIGVGLAGMMTYGSYLPNSFNIPAGAGIIIASDTLIALLAGLVIFPLVFTFGLDPASGPGLIFETLPVAFAQMPIGRLFGALFFFSLSCAAITTMIGFVESLISFLMDEWNISRRRAAAIVFGAIAILSMLSIFSYNIFSDFTLYQKDFNALVNTLVNNVLLPLGGFLIVVFSAWFVSRRTLLDQLDLGPVGFRVWLFTARFVAPVAILIIAIFSLTE
jgi:NSS family neurotransmitter:Na+ symporter